ncbi:helicase-primase primase subunit [Anguillid herpesvirus 1]|uniref:Helicase-primase primase subunit n=1 Tax=Anguillid herpesvirus 1 TaxID=150286 RepID=A0A1J0REH7_9VIRU|nr:helicase-primase primase subunit [Anguillid herpesvirus 1]ADA57784.1 helicase-primase primase subunit [Anguillid herpesvirus 1]APD76184.1 helicase-primase primase subunit [Anguillid herpesvirus 1]QRM16316.1 helicase-primase primase subunit [Anguillid herpesvirus 1]QRM16446.1 helicase-primase primase subunit [Anguillid herpesvirus 1]QRM16575.1 helicase-primase primase subunit [Anguillid herpesvirus 1]
MEVMFLANDGSRQWDWFTYDMVRRFQPLTILPKGTLAVPPLFPAPVAGEQRIELLGITLTSQLVSLGGVTAGPVEVSDSASLTNLASPELYKSWERMGRNFVYVFVESLFQSRAEEYEEMSRFEVDVRSLLSVRNVPVVWHAAVALNMLLERVPFSEETVMKTLETVKLKHADGKGLNAIAGLDRDTNRLKLVRFAGQDPPLPRLLEYLTETASEGSTQQRTQSKLDDYYQVTRVQTKGTASVHTPLKRQTRVEDYFKAARENERAAKRTQVDRELAEVKWVYDQDVATIYSHLELLNRKCYNVMAQNVYFAVPPSKAFGDDVSAITVIDDYVTNTGLARLRAHGFPVNTKGLPVIMNDGQGHSYHIASVDLLEQAVQETHKSAVPKTVCWNEVCFGTRVFTRVVVDLDLPCPTRDPHQTHCYNFDSEDGRDGRGRDTQQPRIVFYSKLARTVETVFWSVWSETLTTALSPKPLQIAIFQRPCEYKMSMRIVVKLPFNFAMEGSDTLKQFMSRVSEFVVRHRIPFLSYARHPDPPKPDQIGARREQLYSLFADDPRSSSVLVESATASPVWFTKHRGGNEGNEGNEEPTATAAPTKVPWHKVLVESAVDVNVYHHHMSVRLPWCGKSDKTKFEPVYIHNAPQTKQEWSKWSVTRCLMSCPYFADEITVIPSLGKEMFFVELDGAQTKHPGFESADWSSAELKEERIEEYKTAAELTLGEKFKVKRQNSGLAIIYSTRQRHQCDVCARDHRKKFALRFSLTARFCFKKCFHDQMTRELMALEGGRLISKKHTTVSQYGDIGAQLFEEQDRM